jgi:hypothetical protein
VSGIDKMEARAGALAAQADFARRFVEKLGDARLWTHDGEVIDLEKPVGKCVCGEMIRFKFVIKGPGGRREGVGCVCIEHFQSMNTDLYARLQEALKGLEATLAAKKKAAREVLAARELDAARIAYETVWDRMESSAQAFEARRERLPHDLWWIARSNKGRIPRECPAKYTRPSDYRRWYTKGRQAIINAWPVVDVQG